jgi:hypothetical protein
MSVARSASTVVRPLAMATSGVGGAGAEWMGAPGIRSA